MKVQNMANNVHGMAKKNFFDNMYPMSKKKTLENRLKKGAKKGEISCAKLRKIAEEVEIAYKLAGETADKLKIKIRDCDLGCF